MNADTETNSVTIVGPINNCTGSPPLPKFIPDPLLTKSERKYIREVNDYLWSVLPEDIKKTMALEVELPKGSRQEKRQALRESSKKIRKEFKEHHREKRNQ